MILNQSIEYLFIEVYYKEKQSFQHFDDESQHAVLNGNYYAGFIVVNILDDTHYLSTKFYQSLGYSFQESIPSVHRLENLLHPDDLKRLNVVIGKSSFFLRNNFSYDLRFITKNNCYKTFKTEIKRIVDKFSPTNYMLSALSAVFALKILTVLLF